MSEQHTTEHSVRHADGQEQVVLVSHEVTTGVQYDFYIPAAIMYLPPMQDFLCRLKSIVAGATILENLGGIWKETEEKTSIYRMIIQTEEATAKNIRDLMHDEIGRLMARLSTADYTTQETFMYTETEIRMTQSVLEG